MSGPHDQFIKDLRKAYQDASLNLKAEAQCSLGFNGVPPHHATNCPNIKCTYEGYDGESYSCDFCGMRFKLYYDDMS